MPWFKFASIIYLSKAILAMTTLAIETKLAEPVPYANPTMAFI